MLHVVQIVGIVDDALDVALIVAHLLLFREYVLHTFITFESYFISAKALKHCKNKQIFLFITIFRVFFTKIRVFFAEK